MQLPLKLNRLRVQGFRSVEDATINLADWFSVLVGRNNAGKSNIIDSLVFLKQAIGQAAGAISNRGGFDQLVLRKEANGRMHFTIDGVLSDEDRLGVLQHLLQGTAPKYISGRFMTSAGTRSCWTVRNE
jgi:predicted ATPase